MRNSKCVFDIVTEKKEIDDAWVVDFGGGNTVGWVDRGLHGSVEGDEQALARIKKELAEDWLSGENY